MRKLVYYVAATVDGFIAREDGSFDDFPWDDDYGAALLAARPETFPVHLRGGTPTREDNRCFDAVLMGRKTYAVGLAEGITSPYPTLDQYVFSRTMTVTPDAAVELVTEDALHVVADLKQETGKAIWLCGGSNLATTLLAANLIDELVVKLNPIVFGSGIPLFRDGIDVAALTLTESTIYDSGHAVLRYTLGEA